VDPMTIADSPEEEIECASVEENGWPVSFYLLFIGGWCVVLILLRVCVVSNFYEHQFACDCVLNFNLRSSYLHR